MDLYTSPGAKRLVINMEYRLHHLKNGVIVKPQRFELLAVSEDFQVLYGTLIYPVGSMHPRAHTTKKSEDAEAEIMSFISDNFSNGVVRQVIAPSMYYVCLYLEQSERGYVDERLRRASWVDIDTLIGFLPDRSALYDVGYVENRNDKFETMDFVSVVRYFEKAHLFAQRFMRVGV